MEQRLGELQSSRQDGSDTMSFTPQQEAELDRFLQERARIRTELRAVRRNLDQDIDQLGSLLKAVNIGLVPYFNPGFWRVCPVWKPVYSCASVVEKMWLRGFG